MQVLEFKEKAIEEAMEANDLKRAYQLALDGIEQDKNDKPGIGRHLEPVVMLGGREQVADAVKSLREKYPRCRALIDMQCSCDLLLTLFLCRIVDNFKLSALFRHVFQ